MPANRKINWLDTPERVDELPGPTSVAALGFYRFIKTLQDNPGVWYKVVDGTANSVDVKVYGAEHTEFEFTVRLNAQAYIENPDTRPVVRNKDLYARYMGLEWYLEKLKEKREKKAARTTTRPIPHPPAAKE